MTKPTSPYDALAALLQSSPMTVSPAELQGFLLGRVCAGAGYDEAQWLAAAGELLDVEPAGHLRDALLGLLKLTEQDVATGEITVVLLLPNDDAALIERAQALGQWSQGFLAGFGLSGASSQLSDEAKEVLQDIAAIAQVSDVLEESEAGEVDYMEVMEYLRIAPLLLLDECGASGRDAAKPV